jgi:hypothetical protein
MTVCNCVLPQTTGQLCARCEMSLREAKHFHLMGIWEGNRIGVFGHGCRPTIGPPDVTDDDYLSVSVWTDLVSSPALRPEEV